MHTAKPGSKISTQHSPDVSKYLLYVGEWNKWGHHHRQVAEICLRHYKLSLLLQVSWLTTYSFFLHWLYTLVATCNKWPSIIASQLQLIDHRWPTLLRLSNKLSVSTGNIKAKHCLAWFLLCINLLIIFSIKRLIVWFVKILKIVRNSITITRSPKWHLHNACFVQTSHLCLLAIDRWTKKLILDAEKNCCSFSSLMLQNADQTQCCILKPVSGNSKEPARR